MEVPENLRAFIVLLYNREGSRNNCNSNTEISLPSVSGNMYGGFLNDRRMKVSDENAGVAHTRFRKRTGCVD